uniref:Uncharacterized protein n=1 Tax=Caudovirales sp. ctTVN2 TaxID=2827634 RepID=A0A8S5S8N6_9CAUD|nr:MAG TPA: hypothetical protein [Caudovirales sp. ctTVN2]DAW26995.1 MAG TPA: hypothetical protein [Caudoviricetes sp.]
MYLCKLAWRRRGGCGPLTTITTTISVLWTRAGAQTITMQTVLWRWFPDFAMLGQME